MKKILGVFSFTFLLFALIIFTKDSQAATSLNQLQAEYPTGSKWEDTYIGLKKIGNGYARVRASECAGFAALMYNRYYDMDPYEYANQIYDINQVQPGDIVRYGNNEHSVWILSRNGNTVQVAECNYDLQCSVRWYQTKSISELGNGLTYIYKAPYVLDTEYKGKTSNQLPSVVYRAHVQDIGWQNYFRNREVAGTTGQCLRLEAININLENSDYNGNIEYASHIQDIGWLNYTSNGNMSGTTGQCLRLEAIKIRLTGEIADYYDIYYRAHTQDIGWMGWAKNGEEAGTAGLCYRLEAIQILLVNKGEPAPGSTYNHFVQK